MGVAAKDTSVETVQMPEEGITGEEPLMGEVQLVGEEPLVGVGLIAPPDYPLSTRSTTVPTTPTPKDASVTAGRATC